jgi:hypothetical protein
VIHKSEPAENNPAAWVTLPPITVGDREVSVRRNVDTGKVVVSPQVSWKEIFAFLAETNVPADFLSPEERNQGIPREPPEL